MSGHSKWSTIKHKKGALDAKRGKLFSKLAKEILVAAKLGGGDPAANPRLRTAIMKAKGSSMPGKNIDNAIKKAVGSKDGEQFQEVNYEGYGPDGVAILVECLTDNRNRTVADVRSTLSKNGGNLGETGSVSWQFEKKGIILIEKSAISEDDLMEKVLAYGGEDLVVEEDGYTVLTAPNDFYAVVEKLGKDNLTPASAEITMLAKNFTPVTPSQYEKIQRLTSLLDDLDDVQSVSSNEKVET